MTVGLTWPEGWKPHSQDKGIVGSRCAEHRRIQKSHPNKQFFEKSAMKPLYHIAKHTLPIIMMCLCPSNKKRNQES